MNNSVPERGKGLLRIFFEHEGAALNARHRKSYEAPKIPTSETAPDETVCGVLGRAVAAKGRNACLLRCSVDEVVGRRCSGLQPTDKGLKHKHFF